MFSAGMTCHLINKAVKVQNCIETLNQYDRLWKKQAAFWNFIWDFCNLSTSSTKKRDYQTINININMITDYSQDWEVECAIISSSGGGLGRNMNTGRTAWPFPSDEAISSSLSSTDNFSRTSGFDVHNWIVARCSSLTLIIYLQTSTSTERQQFIMLT